MPSSGGGDPKLGPRAAGVTHTVSGTWVPNSHPEGWAVGPDVEISMRSDAAKLESKQGSLSVFH